MEDYCYNEGTQTVNHAAQMTSGLARAALTDAAHPA
jgi:hypothetical protein